jgi:hypothetical protein
MNSWNGCVVPSFFFICHILVKNELVGDKYSRMNVV